MEVSSIGTNARMATIGACRPTATTTKTSVAAMLYAGATEAVAMIVVETSPRAPDLRPFSTGCSSETCSVVAMPTLLLAAPRAAGQSLVMPRQQAAARRSSGYRAAARHIPNCDGSSTYR
jgi:hypothetical protein